MRSVLASKCVLGVMVSGAAAVCGGCHQDGPGTAMGPSTRPVSMAAADTAVPSPADPPVPPPVAEPLPDVTQSDVIDWAAGGVTDDVIVDRIGHTRSTFHLAAGDEVRLRDAGVSDDVIRAMKATAWN